MDVLDISRAGDILSAAIIALPAIGFARSLSTELILQVTDVSPGVLAIAGDTGAVNDAIQLRGVLIGLMLAIAAGVVWLALRSGILTTTPVPTDFRRLLDPRVNTFGGVGSWIVVSAVATMLVTFLVVVSAFPSSTGAMLGGIAITVGILGSWTALIGLLTLVLRRRRPLAAFEFVGFRSDPLIALLLVIPLITTQIAGAAQVHAIDQSRFASPERQRLEGAFQAWLDRNAGCEVDVPGADGESVRIRPFVLLAAEGGGIRAATWTTATMAELVEAGSCASNSVFLSSGVSGGSIGLAIAANPSWDPADLVGASPEEAHVMAEQMRADVLALSESTALATAMIGFLVSDPIAATTGLRLPSAESDGEWRDRASLIENSWRDADERLAAPYDADVAAPTGAVALNATDIRSGCRAIVSQIELGPGDLGSTVPGTVMDHLQQFAGDDVKLSRQTNECSFGLSEPPLTLDVLDYFECTPTEGEPRRANMDWATAGLLSARFPFVTPSGTVGGFYGQCAMPRLQLVDGGYAENSGLALLADTAPRIATLVRAYNTQVRSEDEPLVVPYALYAENSPGSLAGAPDRSDNPELRCPTRGAGY